MIESPVHPGEILLEELLERGFTPHGFAEQFGLDPEELIDVCKRVLPVTPEMALGLAASLGTSVELWINLQAACDESKELGDVSPD